MGRVKSSLKMWWSVMGNWNKCSFQSINDKTQMSNYYESSDLARFADVGTHSKELMDKFFEYYNMATGTEGALTKREKQLIGLAVAHTIQCPYCIDAYTTGCLESGADPAQMTEAIHVVAAVRGGASIVHGVQMLNVLEKVGA